MREAQGEGDVGGVPFLALCFLNRGVQSGPSSHQSLAPAWLVSLYCCPRSLGRGPDLFPEQGDSLRLEPLMISLCHWFPGCWVSRPDPIQD